jgi:tRNA-binding EMAP/Myf-like protein
MTLVEQEQFMPSPIKPLVSLDDIEKIDVRIGTIELVEEVPRSDRLVKLTVNFGDHKRSILVGMKKERSISNGCCRPPLSLEEGVRQSTARLGCNEAVHRRSAG